MFALKHTLRYFAQVFLNLIALDYIHPVGVGKQRGWHACSRPHRPLAPSTSHSSSLMSILAPGHTVLWLPPHLIRVHSCPFLLQATPSSGSLHISFEFTHVHSCSRPHRSLAPSTSHSSSLMSMLAPGHTVLWLPPHLIRVHSCPFLLQATPSSGSLHISFEFTHVHSCSRPHRPLAPSTSHSSSLMSILAPGHTVLWLPPHLIRVHSCPFLYIVLQLSCCSSS